MNSSIATLVASVILTFSLPSQAQTFGQNPEGFESVFNIQTVSGMSLDKRALLGGVVVSSSLVSLSAQVPGDVLSVSGKEGDMFKQGAILVTLEQESIQAERDSTYAEITSANEALRNV